MLSSFPSIFETVEKYRYSTTIGLGLLFLVPLFLPIGWSAVSTTWHYGIGATFFLSVGMIITKDAWPLLQRMIWGRTSGQEQSFAKVVVRHCKSLGGDPPFEINVSSLETENIDEKVLVEFLRAVAETDDSIRLEDQTIIVTEEGLEQLTAYL